MLFRPAIPTIALLGLTACSKSVPYLQNLDGCYFSRGKYELRILAGRVFDARGEFIARISKFSVRTGSTTIQFDPPIFVTDDEHKSTTVLSRGTTKYAMVWRRSSQVWMRTVDQFPLELLRSPC